MRLLKPFLAICLSGSVALATDASAVTGVKTNSAGDLAAFLSALLVNGVTVLAVVVGFTILRVNFPSVYSHREIRSSKQTGEESVSESSASLHGARWQDRLLGWVTSSLRTTLREASRHAGLDAALLVEFSWLGAKVLGAVGVPMAVIMCPLHHVYGGGKAGDDRLGSIEMANIDDNHPWLFYVHASLVWPVCFAVHHFVCRAQARFLESRLEWLQSLPAPRSTTVLVEAIPKDWRSDAKLTEFFGRVFSPADVLSAHVVQHAGKLAELVSLQATLEQSKRQADLTFARDGIRPTTRLRCLRKVDSINYYEAELERVNSELREARADFDQLTRDDPVANSSHCGFVTFKGRRHAEMAQSLQYSANKNLWQVLAAPVAADVRWSDLRRSTQRRTLQSLLGVACVLGLFLSFIPIVLFVTNLAQLVHLGPLQPVWAGLAPTIGLMLFLGLLPTVLLIIFRAFFVLKADAWAQHKLQFWYFVFQLIFVVLVTAVGTSLVGQLQHLAEEPRDIFRIMAENVPSATHFYMNYLALQWTAHAIEMLRVAPLAKFLIFRMLYKSEEAKEKAEPESQDSFGQGARNVQLATNMVLGLMFCSSSPIIPLLAMVDFALARLFYGYLLVSAELKKPDLGGAFWVTSLYHIQLGLFLYCILMVGIVEFKAQDQYAWIIVTPSLLFVAWSHLHLRRSFQWQKLPFEEVAFSCEDFLQHEREQGVPEEELSGKAYVQPELVASECSQDSADTI